MKGRVLLTRPLETIPEIKSSLEALGYEAVVNPLLSLVATTNPVPQERFDGIIFTSGVAVRFYCGLKTPDRTPVYTVGRHTAMLAKQAGFSTVVCQGETVPELIQTFDLKTKKRLLYPCGVHTSHDLKELFSSSLVEIFSVPVYDSNFLSLKNDIIRLLIRKDIAWILVFSKRTAEALKMALSEMAIQDWTAATNLAVLSRTVAEPLTTWPWKVLVWPAKPNAEALLSCLRETDHG